MLDRLCVSLPLLSRVCAPRGERKREDALVSGVMVSICVCAVGQYLMFELDFFYERKKKGLVGLKVDLESTSYLLCVFR